VCISDGDDGSYETRGGCRRFGGGPARPDKEKTSRDAGGRSGGRFYI